MNDKELNKYNSERIERLEKQVDQLEFDNIVLRENVIELGNLVFKLNCELSKSGVS